MSHVTGLYNANPDLNFNHLQTTDKMVSLGAVRENNASLKDYGPNTGGDLRYIARFRLGQMLALRLLMVSRWYGCFKLVKPVEYGATARAFVRGTLSSCLHLTGRNGTRASKIMEELRWVNPHGQLSLIKSDTCTFAKCQRDTQIY